MKKTSQILIVALVFVLAFAALPGMVLAQSDNKPASETIQELIQKRKDAAEARRLEAQQTRDAQLEERFERACENRKASYKNRLENIAQRSQKHVDVLDKILERLKAFKEAKNVTVENYDALVAEAEAKKLIVASVQEAANEAAEADFSCERDAAKESVAAFRDILKQQIDALKDYKTAVKNLIVAVKTSLNTAESSDEEGGESDESQE